MLGNIFGTLLFGFGIFMLWAVWKKDFAYGTGWTKWFTLAIAIVVSALCLLIIFDIWDVR